MSKDFFDDDLAQVEEKRAVETDRMAAAERPAGDRPSRLLRHKDEVASKVSDSMNQLEQLRRRQEELEREKSGLENLSRKQEEYERGKRDIIEKLDRSIILLEKEENQVTQMAAILSTTLQRFRDNLAELRKIDEERWPAGGVAEELNKALAVIDEAKEGYKKSLAKIEAERQDTGKRRAEALAFDAGGADFGAKAGFGFWLKVGLAVTLPIAVVMVVLFIVYIVLSGAGMR